MEGGGPDVIIDARCFRPPPRDWTDKHIGYSLTMSRRLVQDVGFFQLMWFEAIAKNRAASSGLTPVNIAVFLQGGREEECVHRLDAERMFAGACWLEGNRAH